MTMTVLLVIVCLLAIIAFVQLGALVEMYEQLKQVRAHLNMIDNPTPLGLGASQDRLASDAGLPAVLDAEDKAVLLFLSNRCETCFELASVLQGGILPPGLWVVVVPVSGDASDFVERFGLRGERITVDDGERIVGGIGLEITPAAVTVEHGRLVKAQTVPTVRQMLALLPFAGANRRHVLVPRTPAPPAARDKPKVSLSTHE